ncbi:hypothetical protein NEHOM01_2475 [Nematocida homosporus]|uniref:uncharacterized protein n=1 Tax=Nematocida homosporus TaxID=1912981 RepID=UPI00221EDF49|nr:uncharacterized protein NEHOM01_2475 [Nematocida homosporus]KAI5187982.1 hypothetical protein NEHOM01_2475 [Nematocida homosporus]
MVFVYTATDGLVGLGPGLVHWGVLLLPRMVCGWGLLAGTRLENLPETGLFLIYILLLRIIGILPSPLLAAITAGLFFSGAAITTQLRKGLLWEVLAILASAADGWLVCCLAQSTTPFNLLSTGLASFLVLVLIGHRPGVRAALTKDLGLAVLGFLHQLQVHIPYHNYILVLITLISGFYFTYHAHTHPHSTPSKSKSKSTTKSKSSTTKSTKATKADTKAKSTKATKATKADTKTKSTSKSRAHSDDQTKDTSSSTSNSSTSNSSTTNSSTSSSSTNSSSTSTPRKRPVRRAARQARST